MSGMETQSYFPRTVFIISDSIMMRNIINKASFIIFEMCIILELTFVLSYGVRHNLTQVFNL